MQNEKIMEAARDQKYQVKGLRTFVGMEECGGFNANLYRDGKKVAAVLNDDSGGPCMWRWESDQEEAKLNEVCKTIPPDTSYNIPIECDPDIFISVIIQELEEERYWRRKCKSTTCIYLHSDGEGQYRQYKRPYDAELAKVIRERHGDDLKEIINERFLTPEVAKC